MLRVEDIHTYYGDSHIIQGLSMEVAEDSLVAVLGRNGVGKTTLVHSINGFTPPGKGRIFFKGAEITRMPAYRISRMGIRVVPQGRRIFPSLTVKENLSIAAKGNRKSRETGIERIFEMFPVLKERVRHKGNELSGGEQQMLAIGRALIGDPELILLDEPSEGLAPRLVEEVAETITKMKGLGISMLLVEQDVDMALALADYAYIVSKGKIVHESEADSLAADEEMKTRYLGLGD
jgi:branched-chain amino acid transport system ATP-binding protein